jgi:hypothetical protein
MEETDTVLEFKDAVAVAGFIVLLILSAGLPLIFLLWLWRVLGL